MYSFRGSEFIPESSHICSKSEIETMAWHVIETMLECYSENPDADYSGDLRDEEGDIAGLKVCAVIQAIVDGGDPIVEPLRSLHIYYSPGCGKHSGKGFMIRACRMETVFSVLHFRGYAIEADLEGQRLFNDDLYHVASELGRDIRNTLLEYSYTTAMSSWHQRLRSEGDAMQVAALLNQLVAADLVPEFRGAVFGILYQERRWYIRFAMPSST